jgi:16S rRNA (guanine527-N7)-methyltransferase
LSDRDVHRGALIEGARSLGIEVGDALADAMTLHYELVARWAERMNLTAIKEPVASAHLHGLDSLLFAEVLGDAPSLAGRRAVDVGSGAGFPGLIVALARPELAMTLLEPIRKRASFLRVALADLGRADVAVLEGKLEAPAPNVRPSPPWPADIILSRATVPPLELIALAAPRLKPGGSLVLSGGRGAPSTDEISEAGEQAGLVHQRRRDFVLPGGELRVLDVLASLRPS